MIQPLGTEFFWITLLVIPAILLLAIFIGHALCKLFPSNIRTNADFYLAPVLGLAALVVVVSIIGRLISLGNFSFIFFVSILLALFFIYRRGLYQILRNFFVISIFVIVCGVSILTPLFYNGALNSHNDTFTYLAHSSWLQNHAFNETISINNVTPLTTQISLYQTGGFRMGGSFLLALVQSLFNIQWSYEAYAAIIIIVLASCCLAIGFPIAQAFPKIKRRFILLLIALPALSFGGLVFSANFGFLPQVIGLSFATGFLVTMGFTISYIIEKKYSLFSISKLAFLNAILFSAITYSYSEITPFLLIALLVCGLFLSIRFLMLRIITIFVSLFLLFSLILLNSEILRAVKAILTQSTSVVGTPVLWSPVGYLAHTLGIHGGAWDVMQWSILGNTNSMAFILVFLLMGVLFGIIFFVRRLVWQSIINGKLMPVFMVLIVFLLSFIYFRYFVSSTFPTGIGQSWSQFKLSDWANPFLMIIVLFSLAALQPKLGKLFNILLIALFSVCLISTIFISIVRIKPLVQYYNQTHDLDKFYINFRNKVNGICPVSAPIYLNLGGSDLKFRQMALLYLYDREVKSDWTDDGYIYLWLPVEKQNQEPIIGDCVVEPSRKSDLLELNQGEKFESFHIGIFQGSKNIRIVSIIGSYGDESDEKNYWNWVEHEITFKLRSVSVLDDIKQTRLFFEYETRSPQILNLNIIKIDGKILNFTLKSTGNTPEIFERIIDLPPSQLSEITIQTDGVATRLSKIDPRFASFIIKNIQIQKYKK